MLDDWLDPKLTDLESVRDLITSGTSAKDPWSYLGVTPIPPIPPNPPPQVSGGY